MHVQANLHQARLFLLHAQPQTLSLNASMSRSWAKSAAQEMHSWLAAADKAGETSRAKQPACSVQPLKGVL